MKRSISALIVLLAMSSAAHAQLGGLRGLADKVSGADSESSVAESVESAEANQERIVSTFKDTLGLVLTAQARLQEAFGRSEEAAALQLDIDDLRGECAQDCLERMVEVSAAARVSIGEKITAQEGLQADKNALYLSALPPYIEATLKAKDLAVQASDWSKQSLAEIKDAGIMNGAQLKGRLEIGTFVATNIPSLVGNWTESTKQVLTFAKANNLALDSIQGINDFDF
jgi:hypothetical protein